MTLPCRLVNVAADDDPVDGVDVEALSAVAVVQVLQQERNLLARRLNKTKSKSFHYILYNWKKIINVFNGQNLLKLYRLLIY